MSLNLGKRLAGVAIALTLAGGTLATPTQAVAADYRATIGTCTTLYNIPPAMLWGQGVNFVLGSHAKANVTLYTRYSWGWKRNARGLIMLPSRVFNQYHVRFLDSAGRVLWTEYNSIPNGGSRRYSVGSNVWKIQVMANQYSWGWAAGPGVALSS